MAKKFIYSIVYKKPSKFFWQETFIKARSRKMALRKLYKQVGHDFEYEICKDYN